MNRKRLLAKLRTNQQNIKFSDFTNLAEGFGFTLDRTKGSHKIFVNSEIGQQLNLQSKDGKAKPYQIKQFLDMIDSNDLKLED